MARCRGYGGSPQWCIEEGWAMSVDRLAGSGTAGGDTEPARRRRAQRRRTGRRPGTDAGALGPAEPGQAGEATAAPESNVILLGQQAGPSRPATSPEGTAAPPGQAPAAATAHAVETARTEDAAVAEAAAPAAPATAETAIEAGTTEAATIEAGTTEAAAIEAAITKTGTTEAPAPDTAAAAEAAPPPDRAPRPAPADAGLFARYTRDYVTGHDGHQTTILQAGCTTADGDLGVGVLREAGADIVVSLIDDDQPVTCAALGMDESLAGCVQGDLRTVPLPPRSQDIVLCALLLQRIEHAELVLDRLVAAIKPGGLLLLRFSDRDSSAGFLDRMMPLPARSAVWRKRRPSRPGPYPAVYERLSSARGVQAYA